MRPQKKKRISDSESASKNSLEKIKTCVFLDVTKLEYYKKFY